MSGGPAAADRLPTTAIQDKLFGRGSGAPGCVPDAL